LAPKMLIAGKGPILFEEWNKFIFISCIFTTALISSPK
jgi:hypothetical protein